MIYNCASIFYISALVFWFQLLNARRRRTQLSYENWMKSTKAEQSKLVCRLPTLNKREGKSEQYEEREKHQYWRFFWFNNTGSENEALPSGEKAFKTCCSCLFRFSLSLKCMRNRHFKDILTNIEYNWSLKLLKLQVYVYFIEIIVNRLQSFSSQVPSLLSPIKTAANLN